MVTFGERLEIGLLQPRFLYIRAPKADNHRAYEQAMNRNQAISVNDVAAALFVSDNRVLAELIGRLAPRASAVVFEHPYMAPLIEPLRAIRPELPIIYSAHNVEAELKHKLWRERALESPLSAFVTELEARTIRHAELIVACTEEDARQFKKAHSKVLVAPNGCEPPANFKTRDPRGRRLPYRAGFLGSAHPPNVEAARYVVQTLAPQFPDVEFELVGGVCWELRQPLPANVILHGQVSESAKAAILARWDIGLNPMASGGGSSLKLPDYMANGLPSLNTPIGARGFPIKESGLGRVAELSTFASALRAMIGDQVELGRFAANARRYATEQLAWTKVVGAYRANLSAILTRPAAPRERRLLGRHLSLH